MLETRHAIQRWAFDETLALPTHSNLEERGWPGMSQKCRGERTLPVRSQRMDMSSITMHAAFTPHGFEIRCIDFSYHGLVQ